MADLLQYMPKTEGNRYGLNPSEYEDIAAKFDAIYKANGISAPSRPQDLQDYMLARDKYVQEEVTRNGGPSALRRITALTLNTLGMPVMAGKEALDALGYGAFGTKPPGGYFAGTKEMGERINNSVGGGMRTLQQVGQRLGGEPFSIGESVPWAALASPVAGDIAGQIAPPVAPPPPAVNTGFGGVSAPSITVGDPGVTAQTNRILELIKSGSAQQQAAAKNALSSIQNATGTFNEQTGTPQSLLDFARAERDKVQRPERDNTQLTEGDKFNMITRLGLGVLARNKKGFGEALGESGTAAADYGDKALGQRYQDALAKYTEKMAQVNADTNLTATDQANKIAAAQRTYEKNIALVGAQEKADTSGVAGINAQAGALEKQIAQAVEQYKAQLAAKTTIDAHKMMADAELQKARMMLSKGSEFGPKDYMGLAASLSKQAEEYSMMGTNDEEKARYAEIARNMKYEAARAQGQAMKQLDPNYSLIPTKVK